jgi:hypothetical protein
MTSERHEAIKRHLNEKLSEFNDEFLKLALENDHPYISIYLQNAVLELRRSISKGYRTIGDLSEVDF